MEMSPIIIKKRHFAIDLATGKYVVGLLDVFGGIDVLIIFSGPKGT